MPAHTRSIPLATAAISCRCPSCGIGALFDGFITVRECCDSCGLSLKDHDSGDGPAVFLIFIIGFIVPPAAIITELATAPPVWVHVAAWPLMILALTLLTIRPAKALTIALQYRHRSSIMESGAREDGDGADGA